MGQKHRNELAMIVANLKEKQMRATRNLFGLYRATVVANGYNVPDDKKPHKDNLTHTESYDHSMTGRVRVRVHAIHDPNWPIESCPWAELCTPYGGSDDIGMLFIPEVGANVFVEFLNGISTQPIVVGTWWQEGHTPRAAFMNPASEYTKNKVIRTRKGHMIEIDDSEKNSGIRFTTSCGNHISMDDSDKKSLNIYVKGDANVVVEGNKNETIKKNYNLKVDGKMLVEVKKDIHITTPNINTSANIQHQGDINVSKGNFKLHNGSIALEGKKEGNIVMSGTLTVDGKATILGDQYLGGQLVADGCVYTKQEFFDAASVKIFGISFPYPSWVGWVDFIKAPKIWSYTQVSKWIRTHVHPYFPGPGDLTLTSPTSQNGNWWGWANTPPPPLPIPDMEANSQVPLEKTPSILPTL